MSRFAFLAALVSLVAASVLPSASAFSLGSGTCYAEAEAVTRGTGKHPITPVLGFYLTGLPVQYQPGTQYNVVINNNKQNPNITYFNGFLLYAHDQKGQRQGTFAAGPESTVNLAWAQEARDLGNGQFACDNAPGATITHNSAGQKTVGSVTLRWTAPSTNVGPLVWRGLVETSQRLQYTQVLVPWTQCDPNNSTCKAFDPSTLPRGPLPSPPDAGTVQPFGLAAIDQSACGNFSWIPVGAVPPGFCASLYSTARRPRGIYVTDHGDLLVVETGAPTGIQLLRDLNGNGQIDGGDESVRILTAPSLNHGLYVHNGYMYFSSPNTVWRIPFNSKQPATLLSVSDATVVVKNIPGGGHATRTPLVSHDNRWLYVSVGSAGNLDEDDSRSRVIRYDLTQPIPTGGWQWNEYASPTRAVQAFAKGLRNEVGLAVDLRGEIWGVMNADDNLNRPDLGGYNIHNDNPAERVDHLRESDMEDGWYGYPFCWVADILANHSNGEIFAWGGDGKDWYRDGEHTDAWCRQNTIPASYALQAHTAPLGLVFYDGRGRYAFPPEYYNQIIVAEHGSWNSDQPRGYKLARIGTDERGEALASTSRDFFAYQGPGAPWTWPSQGTPVRPVEVRVGPEGELYVSSDTSNQILVIRHINDRHTPVLMPQLVSAGYNYSTIGGPTKASAEFSFDEPRTNGTYRWREGGYPRMGVAQFDGASLFVNMTAADNNAGAAAPNITGGNSTFEMWINIDPKSADVAGAASIVLELLAPGSSEGQDDFLRVAASVSQTSPTAELSVWAQRAGQPASRLVYSTVSTGAWHYVAVRVSGGEMQLCVNGAVPGKCTDPASVYFPSMWRRSALLGTSYRYQKGGQLANFTGYLDDVRLYSYALSHAQLQLNFILSADDRTNPILQANLHMQPPENSEPRFFHVGPSNRYGPQPQPTLLPGWVYLNGSQLINVSNPMSGLGHAWRGNPWAGARPGYAAMAVELWFRLASVNELADGVVLLDAPGVVRIGWSRKQLQVQVGSQTFPVKEFDVNNYWTHFVFVASPGVGGSSYYTSYVNATATPPASGTTFAPGPVTGDVTLGGAVASDGSGRVVEGLNGDLGIFRVYDFPLNATHVQWLYNVQVAEGARLMQQAREMGLVQDTASDDDDDDDDDDGVDQQSAGLGTAAMAGVVLVVLVAVAALVGLGVWRLRKARAGPRAAMADGYSAQLMTSSY